MRVSADITLPGNGPHLVSTSTSINVMNIVSNENVTE